MGWPDLMDGAIADILLSDQIVKAKCGTRVWRGRLPDGAVYPALVLSRVSTVVGHTLSGSSGLDRHRIQIDVHDDRLDVAAAVALAVRDALDNFTGDGKYAHISCARLLTSQEVYDQGTKKWRVIQDWHVWEERP